MATATRGSRTSGLARFTLASDALSLTNVHSYYGDSHILHGVSFSLAPGGVLALLGRNGAGKTTCISTIIGFLRPRGGEITLFGEPIGGLSPERISHLGIGLVPQGRRIFSSLTVRGTHSQIAGPSPGVALEMPAIGPALMGNPRVLLLDEPSEGRAPLIVAEVGRTIRRLKEEGQSIVLVEQNRQLALDVADQAVILNTGRCVFTGPAGDVLNNEEMIAQNLGVFRAH